MKRMILMLTLFLAHHSLEGKVWGKVELAPTYIHLDILEGGHTVSKADLPVVRADAVVIFCDGWCVKPVVMYGKNETEFFSAGVGVGHCIPFRDCFYFTPSVGVTYTDMSTSLHIEIPMVGQMEFRDHFHSYAPYLAAELTYCIADNMRVSGTFQWAWCHTHTKIKGLLDDKSWSSGPSFGAQYEYDLNKCWSVNVGAAYNESMGETKDGIRGYGGKVGLVRWF